MRILHVYKDYSPVVGGIENHTRWLAEAQVAKGQRVDVLVTNPAELPRKEIINGVRVIRAGRVATVASAPLSITFPILLFSITPDVTHLQFPYPVGEMSQLLVSLFRRNRPFVISYQSDVVKQQTILRFYRPLLRQVLKKARLILTSSPQYIRSSPFLRPLAAKCRPVPLGIDPAPFQQATPLLPPTDRPRILFVGRHRYYKGVDTLIRAMVEVPGADLLIGGSGPERTRWEQLSVELDLQDRRAGEMPAASPRGL